jgi:hypothetical protein
LQRTQTCRRIKRSTKGCTRFQSVGN